MLSCHPPCEDVSWKIMQSWRLWKMVVILLVRMWVEKSLLDRWLLSGKRHPPCEDVSWKTHTIIRTIFCQSHPPCEDVSWKVIHWYHLSLIKVILLVRMWVENLSKANATKKAVVILLVRMWVEKTVCQCSLYHVHVILLVGMWVVILKVRLKNTWKKVFVPSRRRELK